MLRWRYGAGLRWRFVAIGLTEHAEQYVQRGYTPAGSARGYLRFRRFGMPFSTQPRRRIPGTSRACRAIVATRLRAPDREDAVFRALQLGWFTTALVLDEDADLTTALSGVPGVDAGAIVGAIDHPTVRSAYEVDRTEARSAAGSATEFQGKAADTDGAVRYTAPSLSFASAEARLEAGGFQPVQAYDVVIANLDRSLARTPPPDGPLPALERFPDGLTTQEVAAILTAGNDAPDRAGTETALIDLVAAGHVTRTPVGDDAVWKAARVATR